ncbi:Protein AaeX [Burkholderia multivorans]
MSNEISLFSLLVPSLLPAFLGCGATFWIADRLIARTGLYQRIWHPALFRVSLFVCLFSGVGLLFGS